MSDVLHYSFRKVKSIALAVTATLVLSGCSLTTYENKEFFQQDNRSFFEKLKKKPKHERDDATIENIIRDTHETHVKKIDPEIDTKVNLTARTPAVKSVEKFNITPKNLSRVNIDDNSAACRYLRKSADAEAYIVGSPTLSASSDDEGSGSVNLGMNLLDFHKADLIRASGDARCRLHEASKKIEATLGLGVEANRFASANAKANYICQPSR